MNASGNPNLIVIRPLNSALVLFRYDDGSEFWVNREGTAIWGCWPAQLTLDDAAPYLRGPVLGYVLRRRGIVPLHASAVVFEGQAVALLGPPGAGKSTAAALFARRGYPVLSDDLVAFVERGGEFIALPGYPRLCLREDVVKTVLGTEESLPRITPLWDKHFLDLTAPGYRFHCEPAPLGAIFRLEERLPLGLPASFDPIPPRDALLQLVANTYVNYALDSALRAEEFVRLARLATAVPVRRFRPATDPGAMDSLCDTLLEEFRSLISCHHLA